FAGDERRRGSEQREIDLDLFEDSGTANLDYHLAAALQEAAMRLRDRRSRERLRIQAREHVIAELGADHRVDVGEGHRRDLVDEVRKLLDVDVGEKIRPRRQELPELDERRPELFEPLPERTGSLTRRLAVAANAHLREYATN